MTTLMTLTRRELEERATRDDPELTKDMGVRVLVSAKVALMLMDFMSQQGERVEMVRLYGDPNAAEVRFYRSDR